MPRIGDRLVVRPRHGLQVQRGADLFGQVLPQEGQEVTWDHYLEGRHQAGEIELGPEHYAGHRPAAVAPASAAPEERA